MLLGWRSNFVVIGHARCQLRASSNRVFRPVSDKYIDSLINKELVYQCILIDCPYHNPNAVSLARVYNPEPSEPIIDGGPVSATLAQPRNWV